MNKPGSLRAAIEAAMPELARDKDRLLAFIDNGTVVATGVPGESFEWRYTLNIIVTDFAGDPHALWIAVLGWVLIHQSELLHAPSLRDQIRFEVDLLANDKVDLDIKLPLTERVVVVTGPDGNRTVEVVAEPEPTWTT